ncbi:MAG TPA: hypothetical protein VHG28_24565 [Longimicrobiaceae bacterium]|nr:hypothetical protein [Longimicrobiaceae bacterium]
MIDSHTELLLEAWKHYRKADLKATYDLLAPLPESTLLEEPELGVMLVSACVHLRHVEWAGRVNEFIPVLREACRTRGPEQLQRRLLNFEGILHYREGRLGEAEQCLLQLEEMATTAKDPTTLAFALNNLGIIRDARAEWAEALSYYQRALVNTHKLGIRREVGGIYQCMGMAYRELGLLTESQRMFERAQRFGAAHIVGWTDMERALLMHRIGETEVGEALARRALARFEKLQIKTAMADCYRVLAILARGRNDLEEARRWLSRAEALLPHAEPLVRAEILQEKAALETLHGNGAAAKRAASAAAGIYLGMGAPRRVELMREQLTRLHEGRLESGSAAGAPGSPS